MREQQYYTPWGWAREADRDEVAPGIDRVLSERALRKRHEHDWEVKSRFGSWAENVPEGHIGLVLRKDGKMRCILVSKEIDYAHRLGFGLAFFTDEEVDAFPAWDVDGAYGTPLKGDTP